MSAVIARCFPAAKVGEPKSPAPLYRMQTSAAALFGGGDRYVMPAHAVLDDIARFVAAERTRGA